MINVIENSHNADCFICGSKLEYLQSSEELTCFYCGKKEKTNIVCSNDKPHYVCDDCHNISSINYIKKFVTETDVENPFEIAFSIFENKDIPMLGCHHCYILTGSVLASLKNKRLFNIDDEDIEESFFRLSKQAVGGYCGLSGLCGIVPACGVVYSILTGAVCGKDIEQKVTMGLTAAVSKAVYELTGPSCCKAYLLKALEIIISGIYNDFEEVIADKDFEIKCNYAELHPHGCRKEKCPYYNGTIFNIHNSDSAEKIDYKNINIHVSPNAIDNIDAADSLNGQIRKSYKYAIAENRVKANKAPC